MKLPSDLNADQQKRIRTMATHVMQLIAERGLSKVDALEEIRKSNNLPNGEFNEYGWLRIHKWDLVEKYVDCLLQGNLKQLRNSDIYL